MKPKLALVVAIWAAAGAAAAGAGAPRRGGTLRVAIQAEPKTLDPLMAADEPSELVRFLTQGVLVRLNRATQQLEPELAVRWKAVEGGKRLVLELRGGVRFPGGAPFAPKDVCSTFERLLDPAKSSPLADGFDTGSASRPRCTVDGASVVSLHFPRPVSGVERLLDQVPMLSAQSAEGGLGPFRIAENKPGSHLLLVRNPHYWKHDAKGIQLPYLDAVRLEIQRNRDIELLRFERGELDLVNNLDPEAYDRLRRGGAGGVRDLGVSLDTEQLWFNQVAAAPLAANKKAWFRSKAFRAAVSASIRRADLVRVVFRGHALPAGGPVSPANRFWHNSGASAPHCDARSALALLGGEGFHRRGGALYDRAGQPVAFSIITNAGNKPRERMAAMIQQDLAALGIRVSVVPLDFPSLIDRIVRTFDYEACLLGLLNSDLDPNAQMNVWLSSAGQHQWNPSQRKPETPWEREIDGLMLRQASELSPARRKAAFDRVQAIVSDQLPFIYLVFRNAMVAASPRLRNVEPAVLRPQTLWNVERIYVDRQ